MSNKEELTKFERNRLEIKELVKKAKTCSVCASREARAKREDALTHY